MRRPIEIRIDELVLHDVPYGQRHRVREALESELGRLLANGRGPHGAEIGEATLDSVSVRVTGGSAESMGAEIARALAGEIGGIGAADSSHLAGGST